MLATDAVAPGRVAVLVTVCVLAGAVAVCVLVVVFGAVDTDSEVVDVDWVAGSDLAAAVALLTCAAAPEAAVAAFCAALEAAPLVDPLPQALSCSVAIPSAPRTSGVRIAEAVPNRHAPDRQDRLRVVSRIAVMLGASAGRTRFGSRRGHPSSDVALTI